MADENDEHGLASWAVHGMESERGTSEPAPTQQEVDAKTMADLQAANAVEGAAVVEAGAAGDDDQPAASVEDPAPATDDAATAEPVAEATKEAAKPVKGKPRPLEPWMRDRLAESTAKQREAERRAVEAETRAQVAQAEIEALRKRGASPAAAEGDATGAPAVPAAPAPPRADYVPASEVEARAAKLSAEREMNSRADQTYFAGKAAYTDFDDAIAPLQEMGAFTRPDFYEALFATEAAPDVIYYLGSHPNEASKIIADLKGGKSIKAATEMSKIALTIAAEKTAAKAVRKGSQAPAPIKPVGGSAIPSVSLDKMDDDQFTDELNKKARMNGWW